MSAFADAVKAPRVSPRRFSRPPAASGPPPPPPRLSRVLRFLAALLLPFLAALVQRAYWPAIRPFTWFLFYPAAFLSPWIGGPWAGLAAVLECAALGWFFFLPPERSFAAIGYYSFATAGAFTALGVLFCVVHARLRAATRNWRSATEELAELFELASEGIFIADAAGRYIDVNAAGCRLLGRRREEIVGRTMTEIIPLERGDGGVQTAEWEIKRDDGSVVPIEVSASILPDGRWQAFVRDITERRRAEEALRRLAEARRRDEFRAALASTANAMVLVDGRGRIIMTNDEADALFGYPPAELHGRPIEDLVPERFREAHPAKREAFFAEPSGKRRMGAGRTVVGRRKDGGEFPAEIGLTRVRLEGEAFAVASVIDVSERLSFEQKLYDSEERFRLLVQNVKDYAIYMHDADGKVTVWNEGAERLFGYRAEEILGRNIAAFYTPEDASAGKDRSDLKVAVKLGSLQAEARRVRKDGSNFLANVVTTPVYGRDGTLVGYGKVVRDLTEVKKAEEALHRTVQDLQGFAYTVSHDLRSPLRAIQGYAHFAQDRLRDKADPEAMGMLQRISDSAVRLDRLIRDVLSYSAIARQEVALAPVDLDKVVSQAVNLYPILQTARLSVRRPLGTVLAQESLMLQIVSNLLVNAVKFVPAGRAAAIEVRTRRRGAGELELVVEDNGPGIPRVHWERIFRPFSRLPGARGVPGSGIGLAIVKRAVERLGGTIAVESEPCTGTRFTIALKEAGHGR